MGVVNPSGDTHIPREDDEDWPDRHLAYEALEALLCLAIGVLERLIADLEEVLATLDGCVDLLARQINKKKHLHGQLLGKIIFLRGETLEELLHNLLTLL